MENNLAVKKPIAPKCSRIAQQIFSAFVVVTLLFALSVPAFASKFTYSYSGSSNWTLNNTVFSTSYNLIKSRRYQKVENYYTGSEHTQAWVQLTSSYYHYYGESKQTAGVKCTYSHTFNATATGKTKTFAASLGYTFQKQSERSVLDAISKKLKDGWYYYAQRVITRDFKYETYTVTYKKKQGSYVYESTSETTAQYSAAIVGSYCAWIYDPRGGGDPNKG